MLHALLFLLIAPAGAQDVDYFPLQVGNQWVYRGSRFQPEPLTVVVAGTRTVGNTEYFQVAGFPGGNLLLRKDDNGSLVFYDANAQQERVWVPLQAAEGETFRTGIDSCTASGRVRSRHGTLKSPLGNFDNALVIAYQQSCADAGLTSETFLPWVGLAERRQTSFTGERSYELIYARIGGFTVFSEKENSFGIALDANRYRRGDTMTVRMTWRNTQDEPMEVTFPSGQDFDVVIRNENGDAGYTWSATRSFAQIFRQIKLQGERNFVALVPLDLPPGNYTTTANLAVTGARIEATASFTIQ